MKKFLAIFAGATILAGAASAANLRLYFSLDNPIPAGHAPLPAPAADGPSNGHALVVSRSIGARLNVPSEKGTATNPCYELAPGQTSGTARFHLWAKVEPRDDGESNRWNGIALGINITGGGVLTEWTGLNVNAPSTARRWQTNSDFDGRNGTVNFVGVTTTGAQGPALDDGWDTGPSYDGGNDDVYMGYLEVTGGAGTEIFLTVGTAGITREGGSPQVDDVNFGWGDGSVRGNQFGAASALADACITPEPASLLLIGLGALALRRR
jgi:hypothetical protein